MKFLDAPIETKRAHVQLNRLGHTLAHNGMTQFTYRTDLLLADIRLPRFWNDARNIMKRGDFIMVDAQDGGAILFVSRVTADSIWVADIGSVFAPRSETDDPR